MNTYKLPALTLFLFAATFLGSPAQAQRTASIPFNESRLPADDLLYQGRILRSDEAFRLRKSGVDLAALNPAESEVWTPVRRKQLWLTDDSVNIQEDDRVTFRGGLLSASGLYRFNITKGKTTAIVHLDKTLHTMLLRKNLLRLMGYKVPAVKWLDRLSVDFSNLEELKNFAQSQIPRATLGAASRWVESISFKSAADMEEFLKDETDDSSLRKISRLSDPGQAASFNVVLRDIAVAEPRTADHYNLAMGTPPQTLTSRTLRALVIPYALADLGESVNKFEWTVGRVSNNEVLLPHFTRSAFATSLDDARWALHLLRDLGDDQLKQAIDLSYLPHEVALLLFEKLKSRRNALLKIFSVAAAPLPVNAKIAFPPHLAEGKLTKEDWKGYGSRFAHGDPESPFKDMHWYVLSKLQSIGIDNLVARANQELSFFNPQEKRMEFILDQFYKGLNHFVQTGEFLVFPISTWYSPIADFGLITSRDVVVGNYLGTDNLVQLADTVGFNVQLGMHVGVENIQFVPTAAVRQTATIAKTWTHLKPLKNLKQAMKEPYKNIAVPLIKWQLGKDLQRLKELSESENTAVDWNIKEEDSALSQMIGHINDNLGVGESLLFMEKLVPVTAASAKMTEFLGSPLDLKVQGSTDVVLVRRTQIYRKDAKTIQVYDDVGHGYGWSFDITLEKFVPLIRLGWRQQRGDYVVRLHEVNLNPDVKENPKLFDSAHALGEFIQTGSSELLTALKKPTTINADFVDKTSRMAILFWRHKKLRTNTVFNIKSSAGLSGKYVLFTNEKQTGWNWEAFAKDFINLGLSKIATGVEWASQAFQNPAETIMGMGTTTSVRFEASLAADGTYDERFMRLTDRWEGWSARVKDVKEKMRKINKKFSTVIFNEDTLNNLEKLKLFNVALNLNLYEAGIERLSTVPTQALVQFEVDHEKAKRLSTASCHQNLIKERTSAAGAVVKTCGSLETLISVNKQCQGSRVLAEKSKCLAKLFREMYEELTFPEITALLGKDNIFVHGSANGFRDGDEILNDPMPSNTSGRIGGRFWNGPFDIIQQILGVQSGEMNGYWLRERL